MLGTKGTVMIRSESSWSDASGSCRYGKGPNRGEPCRNLKTADLDPKSDEKLSLMYLIKQETEGDFPHNEINTN